MMNSLWEEGTIQKVLVQRTPLVTATPSSAIRKHARHAELSLTVSEHVREGLVAVPQDLGLVRLYGTVGWWCRPPAGPHSFWKTKTTCVPAPVCADLLCSGKA